MDKHYTIVEVNPNTGEVKRKLFTGHHYECLKIMAEMLERDWPSENLSLMHNGQHVSWLVTRP